MQLRSRWPRPERVRPHTGDVLAGITVALVLIPQSLAYAELAGMPARLGLYLAAVAPLAAAPFASSPYLQTGPVAITSLLTLGALSNLAAPKTADYIALAALLALVVGVIRILVGLLRMGGVAYLMSEPVLVGFTVGASLVIVASQLPSALGVEASGEVVAAAIRALVHVDRWDPQSVALSLITLGLIFGGRRLHPLFPGVLVAMALAIVFSRAAGYDGPVVGTIPSGFPSLVDDLPLRSLGDLIVPGAVIALVGFAEPSAIARSYATLDRSQWDPNREFVSQGVANLAAGAVGSFPAGGSFSRTAINRLAGARTRWSGAITALAVLAFLPVAGVLSDLPGSVLSAVVIGAVATLIRPQPLLELWRYTRMQFYIAGLTLVLTLVLAPQVQEAVIVGTVLAVAAHLRREIMLSVPTWNEGDELHLKPKGVLYFASVPSLERAFVNLLQCHPEARHVIVHLDGLGRVDVTGALALKSLLDSAASVGLEGRVVDVPPQARKIVSRVLEGAPRRSRRRRARRKETPR
jgi:SulP family sulfate permease